MGKYFGTDGFRGEANMELTADHAYKIGRSLGWYYVMLRQRSAPDNPPRTVTGKDPRRPSHTLEHAPGGGPPPPPPPRGAPRAGAPAARHRPHPRSRSVAGPPAAPAICSSMRWWAA